MKTLTTIITAIIMACITTSMAQTPRELINQRIDSLSTGGLNRQHQQYLHSTQSDLTSILKKIDDIIQKGESLSKLSDTRDSRKVKSVKMQKQSLYEDLKSCRNLYEITRMLIEVKITEPNFTDDDKARFMTLFKNIEDKMTDCEKILTV